MKDTARSNQHLLHSNGQWRAWKTDVLLLVSRVDVFSNTEVTIQMNHGTWNHFGICRCILYFVLFATLLIVLLLLVIWSFCPVFVFLLTPVDNCCAHTLDSMVPLTHLTRWTSHSHRSYLGRPAWWADACCLNGPKCSKLIYTTELKTEY